MTHKLNSQELEMLRAQVEILMKERQSLLRIAGAAAVFVAELDSGSLAECTYEAAEVLAHSLNIAPEETLKDALDQVRKEIKATTKAKEATPPKTRNFAH